MGTQGNQGTWGSQGTRRTRWQPTLRAVWALGHSKGTWTLKALVHLDTRALKGHLGTRGTLLANLFNTEVAISEFFKKLCHLIIDQKVKE